MKLLYKTFLLTLFFFSTSYVTATSYTSIDARTLDINIENPEGPTLLVFWASWCSKCIAEIPQLKQIKNRYPLVELIGVNVNKKTQDGLATQQEYELNYPSIADPDLLIADKFKVKGTPTIILLNTEGKVLLKANHVSSKLRKALARVAEINE